MINIRIQKLLTEHCKNVVSQTTEVAKRGENETHRKIKEREKKKSPLFNGLLNEKGEIGNNL